MLNACAATANLPPNITTADDAEREIAELHAHEDAAIHRQLVLLRYLDEDGHWHRQGATSCAHWLSWRCGLNLGAAREKLRVARALADLPSIDQALRGGAVSYSKVRAMTRVATKDNEARLLDTAHHTTASQLEKICRSLRQVERDDAEADRTERADERWARLRDRGDGTVRFEAILHPDEAERLMEALRTVRADMPEGADLCDALARIADIARAEPTQDRARTTGADRADLIVHLQPSAEPDAHPTTLDDGTHVSAETFRRLACDCGLLAVRKNERGDILDLGRKTRRISSALRRAVMLRDRTCAFPGCDHERFIDIHHAEHWLHGGETKLANLVALCTYHHRLVHEAGWRVEMHEGEPCFVRPAGDVIPQVPPIAEAPYDPLAAYEQLHAELEIDDETGLTLWDGAPPDYAACVEALVAREDSRSQPAASVVARPISLAH